MDSEVTRTPLQKAYTTARYKAGKEAVALVLIAHGSVRGILGDHDRSKEGALLVALQKLADRAAHASTSTSPKPKTLDDLRTEAFERFNNPGNAKREASTLTPTKPKSLDTDAIFAKWNAPKAARLT